MLARYAIMKDGQATDEKAGMHMDISLFMTPLETRPALLAGAAAVVIDALRMTSTSATAFANGCAALYAVREVEEARALRASVPDALLGGERHGVLIEGFDLDNSPLSFSRARVAGRRLIMTTTNGTWAITGVAAARRVLLGAFVNASAVARALLDEQSVVIQCAGTDDRLSLEDVLAGGAIVERLLALGARAHLDDAAQAALTLWRAQGADLHAALRDTHHYNVMLRGGQRADLDFCLRTDVLDAVPVRGADGWFAAQ